MSVKGRQQFLEAVTADPSVVRYVKLFRMPLFLTVLDEDLKKYGDDVWAEEGSVRKTAFEVLPVTLLQFGFPKDEIDGAIERCVTAFLEK